jgi:hypothetical protein
MSKSGIHIKPSKKGTFTAAAKKHGKGVQEFARQVMANKENYSPAMVKKANFARNAAKWKHEEGGAVDSHYQELGGVHSMRPLPGHQVPVGKAFTPTPGHYYPMYERDMQPLPQKARYGADIEPFVYHGYNDTRRIAQGGSKMFGLPEIEGAANKYVTPEMAAAATANYTAAQNQAANPIATAAGITTNSNIGLSTNGLTHEVVHSQVPSTQAGALGMQKQNAASTGLTNNTKNSEKKKKDKSWIGPTLLTGLAMANEMIKGPANRQYYTQYDEPYYNPYPSGTGSQAIYDQGGFINSNAVDFPYKSGIRFREGGEIMNVASLSNPIARMGGNIRRNMMSEYEQGGELELYDDRTGAQPISENPNAGPIVEFKGPSHEERNNVGSNGIPMAWNGNEVEVEGGETAFKDNQGNFQILGNMKNPLTGRKFKQDGKLIAKAERKADKTMQKGLDLINSSDPDNPYEMLRFNSGKAKMQGATQRFQEMEELRNNLAAIQQQKLDLAEALGVEPMEMDKKAYFGKMMTAQGGKKIGFGTKFGDLEQPVYKGMDTAYVTAKVPKKGAKGKVSTPASYAPPLPTSGIFGVPQWQPQDKVPMMEPVYVTTETPKKVASATTTGTPAASSTASTANKASATNNSRGAVERPLRPSMPKKVEIPTTMGSIEAAVNNLPERLFYETTTEETTNPPVQGQTYNIGVPSRLDLTSDAEPFNITNAYPEIYSMATNRYEPVLMQKYRPELLQPYQVSFQDQLNRNTDTFRTMAKASAWNPSAMGALAAQKYAADQGVLGNQFRTNQEISANIANANRQIMNETQQRNLGLADQQYVRQAQARANTNQRTFDTLQSLSTKKLQHQKAMNELKVMENLYNFRFGPNYRAEYAGPNAVFTDRYVYGVDEFGRPLGPVPTQKTQTTKSSTKEGKKYGGSLAREFKNYK